MAVRLHWVKRNGRISEEVRRNGILVRDRLQVRGEALLSVKEEKRKE